MLRSFLQCRSRAVYSFSFAQQLYKLTSMSSGAVFIFFKCVYFIPVSCLISIGVPAATPLGVQALDLMPVEVTWCWLFLWCTCILYCPWYIGQFRSNTSPDWCAVLYLVAEQMAFPFLSCAAIIIYLCLWEFCDLGLRLSSAVLDVF